MTWLLIIMLILIGLIGAANFLSGATVKQVIRSLRPHQGVIGVVALVLGTIWMLNYGLWNLTNGHIVIFLACLMLMLLGLLLGLDLIQSVLKIGLLDDLARFLRPFKGALGVTSLVLAVIGILWRFGIVI